MKATFRCEDRGGNLKPDSFRTDFFLEGLSIQMPPNVVLLLQFAP